MAHVMSLIFFPMSIGFMSHVDFKKRPCHPVDCKSQGPPGRLICGDWGWGWGVGGGGFCMGRYLCMMMAGARRNMIISLMV